MENRLLFAKRVFSKTGEKLKFKEVLASVAGAA